jgi:hypothetical protein
MRNTVIRVVAGFLLLGIWAWLAQHTWSELDATSRTLLSIGFVLALLNVVLDKFLPPPPPRDYEKQNRPYLEPVLVLDEVTDDGIRCHYLLQNIGRVPCEEIVFARKEPGMSAVDPHRGNERDLAPAGVMELPCFRAEGVAKIKPGDRLELHASYHARVYGEQRHYSVKFRFLLPSSCSPGQQLNCLSATRQDRDMSFRGLASAVGADENLLSENGTVTFGVRFTELESESGEETTPKVFFGNDRRSLSYIPDRRAVAFEHRNAAGKSWGLMVKLVKGEKDRRFIAATWHPNGISLSVDLKGAKCVGAGPPVPIDLAGTCKSTESC